MGTIRAEGFGEAWRGSSRRPLDAGGDVAARRPCRWNFEVWIKKRCGQLL